MVRDRGAGQSTRGVGQDPGSRPSDWVERTTAETSVDRPSLPLSLLPKPTEGRDRGPGLGAGRGVAEIGRQGGREASADGEGL